MEECRMWRCPTGILLTALFAASSHAGDAILAIAADGYDKPRTVVTAQFKQSQLFGDRDPGESFIFMHSDRDRRPRSGFRPRRAKKRGIWRSCWKRLSKRAVLGTITLPLPVRIQPPSPTKSSTYRAIIWCCRTGRHPVSIRSCATTRVLQKYEPDPDSHLSRSGYIHPLWSPAGHVVTGDRCPDHPHQRGCFFAWTKCTFRGEPVNFWELKSARPRTSAPPEVTLGPVGAQLVTHQDLVVGPHDGDVEIVIRETIAYRVFAGLEGGSLIDIIIHHEAVNEPLWVEKYLYGGMAFRGPAEWLKKDLVTVTSSEGIAGRASNETRARWCQMVGPVGENGKQEAGVTYFDRPTNPRYPTHLRVHPEKPYFCFAYQQREGLCIDREHPVTLRYRVLIHDGNPGPERIEAIAREMHSVTAHEPG